MINDCYSRACVGAAGLLAGLLIPNVVNAVELSENMITKTVKNIVKLEHFVQRFNGCCILSLIVC
jgi:hypothetical protein